MRKIGLIGFAAAPLLAGCTSGSSTSDVGSLLQTAPVVQQTSADHRNASRKIARISDHPGQRKLRQVSNISTSSIRTRGERLVVKRRIADLVSERPQRTYSQTRIARPKSGKPSTTPTTRPPSPTNIALLRAKLRRLWEAEKALSDNGDDASVRRGLFQAETSLAGLQRRHEALETGLDKERAAVVEALAAVERRIYAIKRTSSLRGNRLLSSKAEIN